jgi:DNA-directed RNA polymerase
MDEQRFERQLKLENDYISRGYNKAVISDHKNKERNYGSHSSLGNLLRRELVGYLGEALKNAFQEIESGVAGIGHKQIKEAFNGVDVNWHRIAHIGLSTLLDFVFFSSDSASTVNLRIAQRIQDDLMFRFYQKANPELYEKCEKYYLRAEAGYRQKVTSTKHLFNSKREELEAAEQYDEAKAISWVGWDNPSSRKVGAWIAAMANQVFLALTEKPLLCYKSVYTGKGKNFTKAYALDDDLRDIETNAQVLSGMRANYQDNPMVCEPLDWTLTRAGGFITNGATNRYPLVRRGCPTEPSQEAIDALNRIQKTAWKINPFVLEVLTYFYERGESINDSDPFRPYKRPEEYDIPKLSTHLAELKPVDEAYSDQERYELELLWKERTSEIHALHKWYDEQAKRRKNGRIHQLVFSTATKFSSEERFWMPWSFDFRTRMYPICILNPQQGNHVNALLMFADGHRFRSEDGVITDEATHKWLAIHLATTKGFSKETFEGRVSWVESHLREVSLVATDPLGRGREHWVDADEPWVYLAACKEYYNCFIAKTQDHTYLQCGIDATASGLQILGALMGDESTCKLVNVVSTGKPSDLYQAIIDKTVRLIKDDRPRRRGIPLDQLSRSVAKAPTMTLAYGSTEWTRKLQVFEACNSKRGLDLGLKWEKTEYIAKKLDEAIALVLPGVTTTLAWLQSTAVTAMANDKTRKMVSWITPTGSVVYQPYFVPELQRVKTVALGMTKYVQPRDYSDSEKPDYKKVESSTAANFVHSLDASIIQFTLNEVTFPMSATHDCVYARAGADMEAAAKQVREAFIRVVEADPLKTFAEVNGVPELFEEIESKRNDQFKVNRVRRSRYFFC